MRLGGPVFMQTEDPEELARAHRALGYRVAYCPPVRLEDADRVQAIRRAFESHDVVIAEVGVWNNLMEIDDAQRKKNLQANKEALALADEIGALCAVNITGSLSDDGWDAPDPANLTQEAFEIAVMNARDILRAVKPTRAYFTYEMMPWAIPDSTEAYLALIDSIDHPQFGVHLDVANIINSVRRYFFNTDVITECLSELGEHIVSCHLKDVRLEGRMTTHLDEVRPGLGALDHRAFLQGIYDLAHQPPIMLEHLPTSEEYAAARKYVVDLGEDMGITFAR